MPSNHLIFCRPRLLPPSIFPSIRVFSKESVLRIRWSKFRLKLKTVGKTTRPFRYEVKWNEVAQSCPTLCNPMDCSLPGSSFHGIFQAIVLEGLPFPSPSNKVNWDPDCWILSDSPKYWSSIKSQITFNNKRNIIHLLCARHCPKGSAYVNSLKPYHCPINRYFQYPYFTDEKIEVCRG